MKDHPLLGKFATNLIWQPTMRLRWFQVGEEKTAPVHGKIVPRRA